MRASNSRTSLAEEKESFRDDTHKTFMKIDRFSRTPTLLVHLRPKSFRHLEPGRPISNEPLLLLK